MLSATSREKFYKIIVSTVLLFFASEVDACSTRKYNGPIEMAFRADLVILVTVIGLGDAGDFPVSLFDDSEVYTPGWANKLPPVKLRVQATYKGSTSQSIYYVAGWVDDYKGGNSESPPFHHVREGGQYGSCYALDYKVGKIFLLFLRHGSPYWAALAPVNEEVSGPDDPWVWWVRGVIAAQKYAKKQLSNSQPGIKKKGS